MNKSLCSMLMLGGMLSYSILFFILLFLRGFSLINISWWYVWMPIYLPVLIGFPIFFITTTIDMYFEKKDSEKALKEQENVGKDIEVEEEN